ncbi:MAG: DUF7453 family protein [Burkholderiales bacterium]
MRRALVACALAWLSIAFGRASSAADSIEITVIADSATVLPGFGAIVAFGPPPAIDGDSVAFIAKGANSRQAIYGYAAGKFSTWVDDRTPIPGGKGTFVSFESPVIVKRGNIAFRAIGTHGQDGIYTRIGGRLSRIADTHTAIPHAGERFSEFGRPAFDGRYVVFTGRGAGGKYHAVHQGVYRYDTQLSKLAQSFDWTMWAPGKETARASKFAGTTDNSIGKNGRVAVYARDGNDLYGIYVVDATGRKVSADPGTLIPDRDGETFKRFDDQYFDQSFETDNLVFKGKAGIEEGAFEGVFARIEGQLMTVATNTAAFSERSGAFMRFRGMNIFRDSVFFVGVGQAGHHGVYGWSRAAGLFKIIDSDERIGGKTIKELQISQAAADAAHLVFSVRFEDGSAGIYRARLPRTR